MELFGLFVVIIVFDMAAILWGVDSRDTLNSPEWEKQARRGHAF
jgi:hypothetical protein